MTADRAEMLRGAGYELPPEGTPIDPMGRCAECPYARGGGNGLCIHPDPAQQNRCLDWRCELAEARGALVYRTAYGAIILTKHKGEIEEGAAR